MMGGWWCWSWRRAGGKRCIGSEGGIHLCRRGGGFYPPYGLLAALMEDPRPEGCLKLVGEDDEWRVRVEDWRIVYRIDDGVLVVLVVRVGPRGGVYRGVGGTHHGR